MDDNGVIAINDQPISATFFNEGRWLTSFITPNALEVRALHQKLVSNVADPEERIRILWKYVASNVRYVKFVKGRLWVNGRSSVQQDLWTMPGTTIKTGVGNCAVKSFLLVSLLRNELDPNDVLCVLGNLYGKGRPGGHAWVAVQLNGVEYTMESTTDRVPHLVPALDTKAYEPVHYFNDVEIMAVEGRTQMVPFADVYSTWLSDYLHKASMVGG